MAKTSKRAQRVGELIKEEISNLVLRGLKDPRLGFVTITEVRVSNDLQHARVFVSVYGEEEENSTSLEGLRSAAGFIRREVGKRLSLRYFPELDFVWDKSIRHGAHIYSVLKKVERSSTMSERIALYEKIGAVITDNDSFLITSHCNPEGDSIGSQLALAAYLQQLGKEVIIRNESDVPVSLQFLPGSELINAGSEDIPFTAAFIVDCSEVKRVGNPASLLSRVKTIINIDHHCDNTHFGQINLVDEKASAAGEIIYSLLQFLGAKLEKNIAACLYAAILTDTGSFRYVNTTARTHRIVAELLEAGVSAWEISHNIYELNSSSTIKLLGLTLATLQLSDGGKVASLELTRQMHEEAGARDDESEGFVEYARSIGGVEVALLIREINDREVKVSLRSRNKLNVQEVAASFKGGGHPQAAGCVIMGSIAEVKQKVLAAVRRKL